MRSLMNTARGLAFVALSRPLFAADPHVADGPGSKMIFYVIGGVIVLAVVIFVLTRKKK